MHLADILAIAAYLLTLMAIGASVHRRQKTTDAYSVAGRSVPGWAAGLSLLAILLWRAGRAAALTGISVNLFFTAYTKLTANGGKIVNLQGYIYPWDQYTFGAIGNVLLLATGCLVAMLFPASSGISSRNMLWAWLADRGELSIPAFQFGETR